MTIRTMLDATVQRAPSAVAMRFRDNGAWASRTYGEFYARIRQAAEVAGRLGVEPGRDHVALVLENGPEWMEIYAALSGAGVTVVPVDPKLRVPEIAYILENAEAVALFTSGRHRPGLEEIAPRLTRLKNIVFVDGADAAGTPCGACACQDYETALAGAAAAAAAPDAWFERHRPEPGTVASIIYTSGTTGKPKGAMLTHGNFCADIEGSFGIITDLVAEDRFLVVLPLFHSFSFTANFLMPICRGSSMNFVQSLRTLGEDLKALQPSIVMGVPLLIEKMYDRIEGKIASSRFAQLLLRLGLGRLLGPMVKKSLGGRLRLLLVGGAPSSVEMLVGFRRLGIDIIEGYGLTETSPVVSLSHPRRTRPGTIGYRLPNIEVRIAAPNEQGVGELQVRGPIVMKGYYRNEAATAEAFDGDWFRTGDLATIDADGYIAIRGRRKALIVNREGKNIYPEEVEQCIARSPMVLDVIVVGYHEASETGEKVGAIVTPSLNTIKSPRNGVELPWAEVEALLRQAVAEQCRDLADYKHPRKLDIRRDPLERTSTQKIRRVAYQGQLDTK